MSLFELRFKNGYNSCGFVWLPHKNYTIYWTLKTCQLPPWALTKLFKALSFSLCSKKIFVKLWGIVNHGEIMDWDRVLRSWIEIVDWERREEWCMMLYFQSNYQKTGGTYIISDCVCVSPPPVNEYLVSGYK